MSRLLSAALVLLLLPAGAQSYAVLSHEAIVDTLWSDGIQPALLKKFPGTTPEQLVEAHAYAYGGCIIQDLGYYPFSNHLFSDLVHYVRSADFVQALLDESKTLDEYAFALGAVAHFGADIDGHTIGVNRAVPLLFPKLRAKFGDEVTYADAPSAHLKTEFGFDVLQIARGNYAPKEYHDFIGFQVSKDVLNRAFYDTYALTLKDLFRTLDLSLGTYRFSVRSLLPNVTKAAWALKSSEIAKLQPTASRKKFIYTLSRSSYRKEWGTSYKEPNLFVRFLTLLSRFLPKVGPLRGLGFRVPTPEAEKLFEDSFVASVNRDRRAYVDARRGELRLSNRDLDTGKPVSPGEYELTDKTYDRLLAKLAKKKFVGVSPELRANIIAFYARMKAPDKHGSAPLLQALKEASTI
jgi:hypothetical protein